MLKGLPASGKSTYARGLVSGVISDANGQYNWKRVNKDDMRAMFDDGKWSKENERHILKWRDHSICYFLREGYSVICDDTNLDPKHEPVLKALASMCEADFEVKFFDVPLLECIERDLKRGDKSVGSKVIMGMYERYLKKEKETVPFLGNLPFCYIFDIDGTLAIKGDRSPYDFAQVGLDTPNQAVVALFKILRKQDGVKIFIFSGREDSCEDITRKWLEDNDIQYDGLFMRKTGDKRKDSIIKTELYVEHIKDKFNVLGVFDDRLQVCRVWYGLGLPLFRVGDPDANF